MKHSKSNFNASKQLVYDKNMNNSESNRECFNCYYFDIGRNLLEDINCLKNPLTCVDTYDNTFFFQPYNSMVNIKKYQYFDNMQHMI